MFLNGVPIWFWMVMLFPVWWGAGLFLLALLGDFVPAFRTPVSHLFDGLEHLPERVPVLVADEIPYPSHHAHHHQPAITSLPVATPPNDKYWTRSGSSPTPSGVAGTVGSSGADTTSEERSAQLQHELTEVRNALCTLDQSEARGHEYFEEHQRLERRRESLLEELSTYEQSQSKTA